MKKIWIALAMIAAAAPAAAADRRYTVTDFDRVQVEGPFAVTLKTGKAPSARAIGSSRATDHVSIEVQGRTLKVRASRSAWGGYPGESQGPVAIELTTHDLRGASVMGSGHLSIDKAKAMRFDLSLSGSGRISLPKLEADSLSFGQLGSGGMDVGGKVKTFRGTFQGSGDFDGSGLTAEDVQLNADTSGEIVLNAGRSANIVSTGSGETAVAGKVACTVKVTGIGRVRCGKDLDQR